MIGYKFDKRWENAKWNYNDLEASLLGRVLILCQGKGFRVKTYLSSLD